jgi:hypothetical protein
LGGDPLFSVSHGERLSSDHLTFEARIRLAAGGYRTAAPLVFLLYQKGRDSRIFQAQDRAIDNFTLKGICACIV